MYIGKKIANAVSGPKVVIGKTASDSVFSFSFLSAKRGPSNFNSNTPTSFKIVCFRSVFLGQRLSTFVFIESLTLQSEVLEGASPDIAKSAPKFDRRLDC